MNAQLCKPDAMLAAAPIPSRMVFKRLLGQGSRCVATRAAPTSAIREVQQNLTSKKASAVEMVQQYLQQLEKREPSVGSFITVDSEGALAQAKAIDAGIAAGQPAPGPLAGVAIGVKDNICTKGLRTTAGSQVLSNYVPPYDATVTAKLRAAGAVIVGKLNCDEFAMGSTTESSAYKVTRNPWDTERVPGGSSGGSASAVAAGQCVASLGSDTGGSIRQPAHFCGVVGLKPTYGRVSRYGLISYASSLDAIGPLTTSVMDAAIMLNVISGGDSHDATSSSAAVPDFTAGLLPAEALGSQPLKGRKFGVIKETIGEGVDAAVNDNLQKCIAHLQSLGAVVEEVTLPTFDAGLPAYYVLATSEASSNLARYDGVRYGQQVAGADLKQLYNSTRGQGLGQEVKRRILMGTYALSAGYYDAYYKRAQQVRTLVQREMTSALQQYDFLISPTAPTPAYKVGEKTTDPLAMYKGDLMTVNLNLAGLPGIVLPSGYVQQGSSTLPLGLQIMGPAFGEAGLLAAAHVVEQTLGLEAHTPPVAAL